jgi:N-acyl-L-homoserine lactone synthetase
MSGQALAWTPRFSDRVLEVLERVDYRLAETEQDREAIFRLRYDAYVREGAIEPSASGLVRDRFDETGNVWIFGLHIDGRLASSIRIHVATRDQPYSPSLDAFPEVLAPEIALGKTIVDPTRFVADSECARRHPELPYVTVRLGYVASAYFNADIGLAAVRKEHQAFYRRLFGLRPAVEARPFPGLIKPISLMMIHYASVRAQISARHPFMRSTVFERRMLFGRHQRDFERPGELPTAMAFSTVNHAALAAG